jgi:hypothetical protein
MQLLDIKPMGLTRYQFANLESKHKWEEKIRRGRKVYPQLEYMTVSLGVRDCAIEHTVTDDNIDERIRFYGKKGLILIPMSENYIGNGFSHSDESSGGQKYYRSVLARTPEAAEKFIHFHNTRDEVGIGTLLGYPESSCHFFDEVWKKGFVDPIWQQAENTEKPMLKNSRTFTDPKGNPTKHLIRLRQKEDAHLITSVFRYTGVRVISHLPRSFDDDASIKVAKNWVQAAKDLNLDGMQDVIDIQQLPYEWDCFKGMVEVRTPVFKFIANSVPCYPKHVIQQESDIYPEEAPNGIYFPWKPKGGCSS